MNDKYKEFDYLLLYFDSVNSLEDKVVIDCLVEEEGVERLSSISEELRVVLALDPFPWRYIRDESNRTPPGKGPEAGEAEYRAWMEDVLNQLETRLNKSSN